MKLFQRLIVVFSLFCFLFSFAFNPISVSANTAAIPYEVVIGLGGASVAVPGMLIPYIIAVVALYGLDAFGYGSGTEPVNVIDLVIEKAEWLSDQLSAQTREWAVAFAQYIKGTSVIKFPQHMINETNNTPDPNKKDWNPLLNFCVAFFGGIFLLDQVNLKKEEELTSDQLAVANQQLVDINAQLENLQNNVASTNGILSGIAGQFANFTSVFTPAFEHLQLTVSTIRENLVYDFDAVQTQLHTLRLNLLDGFENLHVLEASILGQIKDVNTILGPKLNDIQVKLASIQTDVSGAISNLREVNAATLQNIKNLDTTLKTELGNVQNKLTSIQTDVSGAISNLREVNAATLQNIKNLGTTLETEFGKVQTQLSAIRTGMLDKVADLREVNAATLNQIKTNVNTELSEISNNTGILIDSFNDLAAQLAPAAGGAGSGGASSGKDFVKDGKGKIVSLFGTSNGVLQDYGVGILAAGLIFNQFADIPFFAKLLTVSLSIGAVAILLGIALQLSESDAARRRDALKRGG